MIQWCFLNLIVILRGKLSMYVNVINYNMYDIAYSVRLLSLKSDPLCLSSMRSEDLIQLIDDVPFLETVLQLVEQLQLLFWFQAVNHIQELLR